MKSVEITSSVKEIGALAFMNNNLTSIKIHKDVENIGMGAFGGNNKLTCVDIPDNISFVHEKSIDFSWKTLNQLEEIEKNKKQFISFLKIYEDNKRSAGTYIFDGNKWVKKE